MTANDDLELSELAISTPNGRTAPKSFAFELKDEPQAAVYLLVFSLQPVRSVNLNSSQLRNLREEEVIALAPHGTLYGNVFEVPRNYLLPGRNTIDLLPDADGLPSETFSVRLLEKHQATGALEQLNYWGDFFPAFLLSIGGLAGIFCLAGLLLGMRLQVYIPLLLMAVMFACAGAFSIQPNLLQVFEGRNSIGAAFLIGYSFLLGVILFQQRKPSEPFSPAELAGLVVMAIWLSLSVFAYLTGMYAVSPFYIFCTGAGGAIVFVSLRVTRAFCVDVSAFRSRLRTLESTIDWQADQLDEKSQLVAREMQHNAVLEERQRMMRDIHDGIGGQLLSLMLRVRSGNFNSEETARGIKQSLSDLRLVVDSADHLGGDLMSALATFRSRAQQQLAAAGIKLEWHFTDDLSGRFQSTSKTLDLYRFMQEAVTNIARHSNASKARVQIVYQEAQERLVVEIQDDGCGLPNDLESHAGKGLANLAERARRLKAEHTLGHADQGLGTTVRLSFDPSEG
ncbi:MAG: ATP-binding protein [Marinomonas sp.]